MAARRSCRRDAHRAGRLPVYALNLNLQNVDRSEALTSEIGAYLNAFAAKCKEVPAGR